MKQAKKLFIKLLACFVLLFSALGVLFSGISPWKSDVTANAETVDFSQYWGLEDRTSWCNGGSSHEDMIGFGAMRLDTNPPSYFKTAGGDCWYHGNSAVIAQNNGVDILQFIYINGESARDAITKNANSTSPQGMANTGLWISNPAAWPIAVETGGDVWFRLSKTYYGDNLTISFVPGFELTRDDGVRISLSEEVTYKYQNGSLSRVNKWTVTFNNENGTAYTTKRVENGTAIGALPAVPAKDGYVGYWAIDGIAVMEDTIISANKTATLIYAREYENYLGLEDRSSWDVNGNPAAVALFGLMDFSITSGNQYFKSSVSGCWYHGNNDVISANNGVDILQYIYLNGVSARDLLLANASEGKTTSGNSVGWLANPAAWPIAFETGVDCWIRIDKTAFGGNFTFTFKKGLSLIRNDGERVYVSSDITYTYENGTLGGRTVDKIYTLSFDGTDVSKKLRGGDTIGELPAIPAKDGCEGAWVIDGVEITADTAYNFGANKTAVAVYSKNITETIGLGDWGVPESESDIRYLWIRDNNAEIATAYPYEYWNDHADNKNSNYGVDIMEYILIDGESVRSIINANAAGVTSYKAASTFPLNVGSCYAPICIETAGDGIRFKVMVDYKTSFKVTFKAGFTIVTSEGIRLYTTEDVVYSVGATMGDISKVTGYLLTFEGVETRNIENGQPIGALPAVPAKDGYEGAWVIDGVEITADTVYNYGVDKTAVVVYKADVTDTIKIEFASYNAVQSHFKIFITPASELCSNGWWNIYGDNLKAANNGVDIMQYIYVNDQNIRELSDDNRTNNTYPVGNATGWPTNSDQCRPVFVETNSQGIWVTVLHSFATQDFKVTLKAGFAIMDANGGMSVIKEDVEFVCSAVDGGVVKVEDYTLSFEGLDETLTVVGGQPIGDLPAISKDTIDEGVEAYWTIDGAEITADTVYTYGKNQTAKVAYRKDITKFLRLEDRTSWGACAQGGEFYFAVLDMSTISKDGNGNDVNYLNTNNNGCWYHGNDAIIDSNGGVDIMQYIYINDTSARDLITANVNGANLVNGCGCWLSNPAASPVYVGTTANSGIMIKVLTAYTGNYFEITFKSGFSVENSAGVRVYLTKDVTYKYIVTSEGATLKKGELTDADLDILGGQKVVLYNGNEVYLEKTTRRLTLPDINSYEVFGYAQTLVGWTTDPQSLSNLYPVGYKLDITAAMQLYAVWIDFKMQDGAAVRLTQGSTGIRFLLDIDTKTYDNGVAVGLIKEMGMIITPTDYLETGIDFVHQSFAGLGTEFTYYFQFVRGADTKLTEQDGITTMAGALVNIKETQFARRLSARGYLKVQFTTGVGYVYTPYTEENNARSIYEVATKAYKDDPQYQSNATILNYVNNVADIIWNQGDYSFEQNPEAVGNYCIDEVRVDGNLVTIVVDNEVTSAVINGKRLTSGSSSIVRLGDFVFSVSGFELLEEETGFTFKLNVANETYDKESDEMLYFASSATDLDFFLNDYLKRHSGVIEDGVNQKVNSITAGEGAEEFFNHEWLTMSYYWYNSFEGYTDGKGENSDRIAGMRNVLSSVPVDDYGYVYSSNDRVRDAMTTIEVGEQKMGWPFPNNDTVNTSHWEFNNGSENWTNNIGARASNGLYGANLTNQSANITFTSKSFSSITSKKIYTFYAPLLEFEVRIDDATNIEDIWVWYTTSSSTSYSEDKKVSVRDKAFLNYNLGNTSGAYNHVLYLPMYAESAWGESTSTYMKQLKIEIVLKSGKTISGNVALNYVRPTLDTRMSNNNSILISSLRIDYENTGDLEYLTENITRARKAMNFLMQMYDPTRGLKKESYLVGHGGTKESLNWRGDATNKSIASSISQGYWDILYMPEYDFQSNTYFYKALRDMAYLEDVLAENGITVDTSLATVKTATRNRTTGTSVYSFDLNSIADTVLTNLRQTTENTNYTGFWNAEKGRFVAGYASGENKWYDYGYVAWNLEAIYYGIATEEQATAIMNWLASEEDLYKYVFAPRSNTVEGTDMLNGEYAAMKGEWDFGDNCQYGGAIMYTSFYDLMARIDTLGADNAFERLTAIQNWYKEVYDYYVANGTDLYEFYRYYYDNKGIQCQGMGTAGAVGLDREFLESFLPVSAVAYGFFGINANGNTLEVAPEKPAELDYWKIENLAFNFVKYDLTIYENAIQLNNVRGETEGLTLTVALNYTEGQTVYVNGFAVEDYEVENGKAYITVAFGATVVEVR